MGLFSNSYAKEGPGVPKNAPQKKGVARFFEILLRDYGMMWRAFMLTLLCCIPSLFGLAVGILFHNYLGMVLIAALIYLLGGLLVGPAFTSLQSVLTRCLRDEPCYMWHEYKRTWKNNLRQSMPAGVAILALLAMELFSAYYFSFVVEKANLVMLALTFFGLMLVMSCGLLIFLQIVYIDLSLMGMVKNSLLMFFGYAKRALPAGLITLVGFAALYGAFTYIVFVPLTLLGLPVLILLISDMWDWPVMDKAFDLNARLAAKREEERDNPPLEK